MLGGMVTICYLYNILNNLKQLIMNNSIVTIKNQMSSIQTMRADNGKLFAGASAELVTFLIAEDKRLANEYMNLVIQLRELS